VRSKLRYLYAVMIPLLIIEMLVPIIPLVAGEQQQQLQYNMFLTKSYEQVTPLGMLGKYIIGVEPFGTGNAIVAIDVYNGAKLVLGLTDSLGLAVPALRFWKTNDYFMVTDDKLVVIWDRNLNQVGRYAQDNLKGVLILLNNDLVAWSSETVSVAKAPGYVYVTQYDVWTAVYKFLRDEGIKPRDLLIMKGVNVTEIENQLWNDFYKTVASENGNVKSFNIAYSYDLSANSPTEARNKLPVDIVVATSLNNKVHVATNAVPTVVITAKGTYEVVEGNTTKIKEYGPVVITKEALFGALIEMANEVNGAILEIYNKIEAGATSSAMAYVYEPSLIVSTSQRRMAIMLANGTKLDIPLYTAMPAKKVYLVGDYEIVNTESGITIVYKLDRLVSSFVAQEVRDTGLTSDGGLYMVYVNSIGALELGFVDRYSGRYDKHVLEVGDKVVGAHVSEPLLFLGADTGAGTRIYVATSEPLATLTLNFVDVNGNKILSIIKGQHTIEYRGVKYTIDFNYNPLILSLPQGTIVSISVDVPYGHASYTFNVTSPVDRTYNVVVETIIRPGSTGSIVASAPFTNPFSREFAIISDTEALKYVLPGARSIDAYGSLLAMIEATTNAGMSTISVYRVDGVKVYSLKLPGYLSDVKIYYPYMVVTGRGRFYILDLMSGDIKAEIDMDATGYDIDVRHDYFVAWTQRVVNVVDIRRQISAYIDMSDYGTVNYATVLNGLVYAYVTAESGASNIYVINPVTGGVLDVKPWGGTKVVSYASDGVFHAVTYITFSDDTITDILSPENGLVRMVNRGQVINIRNLGKIPNAPRASELRGSEFASIAMLTDNTIDVYIVGVNYLLVHSIPRWTGASDLRFSLSFLAVAERNPNATSLVVLKDYSGISRVAIITSTFPAFLAVSENLVAYGNGDNVYLIPNPKVIGKYQIEIQVFNENWQSIDAKVRLEEFGIEVDAVGGHFKAYLTSPGTYRIIVSAPYYVPKKIEITVNDTNPATVAQVSLEPQLFTLRVSIKTDEGEVVKDGIITVRGVDVSFEKKIDLSREVPEIQVRKGTYDVSFLSEIFTSATAQVIVDKDTTIALQVNRTVVRVNIKAVDETGAPLSGVSVTLETGAGNQIKLTTDYNGTAFTTVPYGSEINVTAYKQGYESYRASYNATVSLETSGIRITLRKVRGFITIVLQDEEGKPETATVAIKDVSGNTIQTLSVSQVTNIELELGTYTIEGTTSDGRTASTAIILTEDMPQVTATLTFPKKPAPLYVEMFPYLLMAVMAVTAAVIVYRKFFRKVKPKVVK